MNHRRVWLRCLVGLLVLWVASGSAMAWLSALQPTPDKLVQRLSERPLADASPEQRERVVIDLAEQMRLLDVDERNDPELLAAMAEQFAAMTDGERRLYLEQMTPEGIEPALRRVLSLSPKVRQNLIGRTLETLGDDNPAVVLREQMGKEQFDELIVTWLQAYLDGQDTELAFQVQPLIEQLMNQMQRTGDRRRGGGGDDDD